jgi:hypothetical protein
MSVLGVLAKRFGVEKNEHFLSFLPESAQARLKVDLSSCLGISNKQNSHLVFDPHSCLKGLHSSWLLQKVEKFPEAAQEFFKIFFENLQKGVYRDTPLEAFILGMVLHEEDLPKSKIEDVAAQVQEKALVSLLEISTEELQTLFLLLACHFLVDEVRKIISKKQLEAFFSLLEPIQITYLRKLLYLPKKNIFLIDVKPFLRNRRELADKLHTAAFALFCSVIAHQSEAFKEHFYRAHEVKLVKKIQEHIETKKSSGNIAPEPDIALQVAAIKGCLEQLSVGKRN